ncbi:MAG: hypothetical protein KAI74_07515, partial [Kiritimatiellae bacterium]|nr:hypothetical protein [Kiritimatiellia bacterium]
MTIEKPAQNKYTKPLLLLVLAVATILSFQTIHAPFFLDDIPELNHVSSFSSIKDITSPDTFGLKRPIKNLIFWIVYNIDENSATTGHSISIALYIIAMLTLFFWFRLWTKNRAWPIAGTALWALSPTLVSTITWLSCANILVSTIGILAGLICWEYARIKQESTNSAQPYLLWALIITAYTIAFNAYEAAIIFPGLIFIQDTIIKRRSWSKKLLLPYLGIATITILLLLTRGKPTTPTNLGIIGITSNWQLSFSSAFLTLSHIKQWLWPFGSQEILGTFIWNKSASLWILSSAWCLLALLSTASFIFRRRYPMITAGLFWSIIALIPMCNLLPLRSGPFADYYLTLASIGLSLATIFTIKQLLTYSQQETIKSRKLITQFIIFIIITIRLIGIVSAFNWSRAYNKPALLLQRSIQARPYAYHAQARLARIMLLHNQLEYAEQLAKQSLTETEEFALPYNVLGALNRKKGKFLEAETCYKKVTTIEPDNMYAHLSLANLY